MSEEISVDQRKKNQKTNIGCILFLAIPLLAYCLYYFSKPKEKEVATPDSSYSSASSSSSYVKDPYVLIEGTFEGYPEKEKVQPMLEDVMKRYAMPVTNENITKVANMLFVLKKESKVGVTEMEILKHMYQHGSSDNTLPEQAALSSLVLEKTK